MIKTKCDLEKALRKERNLYGGRGKYFLPFDCTERQVLMKYCVLLRKTEYYQNNNKKIRAFIYQMLLRRKQIRYGILIPPNTCGIGLNIAHIGSIVINDKCIIGDNCRIHVGAVLGANGGNSPRIGSNVYIGPGAKIFGDIYVADGVSIGANAVVNHDSTEKNGVYVGIPVKLVRVKEK